MFILRFYSQGLVREALLFRSMGEGMRAMSPSEGFWGRRVLLGEWSIHAARSSTSVLMELQSLERQLKFRRDQIGELMSRKRELQKLLENGKLQQKVKAQQSRLDEQQRELEG